VDYLRFAQDYRSFMPQDYRSFMPQDYRSFMPQDYRSFMPQDYRSFMPQDYRSFMPQDYHSFMPQDYHMFVHRVACLPNVFLFHRIQMTEGKNKEGVGNKQVNKTLDDFWLRDPLVLFKAEFIPSYEMCEEEKLNAATRCILLISLILLGAGVWWWWIVAVVGILTTLFLWYTCIPPSICLEGCEGLSRETRDGYKKKPKYTGRHAPNPIFVSKRDKIY
jgi:hypothetical protein